MRIRPPQSTHGRALLAGPRSGGVLAIAMVVVLTVAALAAGMLHLSSAVTRRQISAVNTKLSFYMAEAGLTEAYAGLVTGRTGMVGTEAAPVAFGEGLFWVEATENADGTTTLRSTGMTGNGRAVLSLVVEQHTVTAASLGMFGAEGLAVGPGVTIDAFDSQNVDGAPLQEGEQPAAEGRLSSNGAISVTGTRGAPVLIEGNVITGPGQAVEVSGAVTITGTTSAARSAVELTPVDVPKIELGQGVLVEGWAPYTILPGKTGLASLSVASQAELVIEGPATLVVGSLQLQPEATLMFDVTNGEIELFVLENLSLEAGSAVVTNATDATRVSIQVAGATPRPVLLAAQSQFMGVIYAPEAEVQIFQEFELFGSLVGSTLAFNGAVSLHYDMYLDLLATELSIPKVVSWRIVELSNPSISINMDPFIAMGVQRDLLLQPSDAHADQLLRVSYELSDGTPLTYEGLESGFDWSTVALVKNLFRDGEELDVDAAQKRTQNTMDGNFDTLSQ